MTDKYKRNIIAVITVLIIGLYFLLFPKYSAYFPKCLFYKITDLYCPGCGSQRCMAALVHGNFVNALHQNALFFFAIPLLLYRWLLYFKKTGTENTIFLNTSFPWFLLGVIMIFTIARNLPIKFCSYLAPF